MHLGPFPSPTSRVVVGLVEGQRADELGGEPVGAGHLPRDLGLVDSLRCVSPRKFRYQVEKREGEAGAT